METILQRIKGFPNQKYLRECFWMDEDGDLVWQNRPREHFLSERAFNRGNTIFPGKKVTAALRSDGRICVGLDGIKRSLRYLKDVYLVGDGALYAREDRHIYKPGGTKAVWISWAAMQKQEDCLIFPFSAAGSGYGLAKVNGVRSTAHRHVAVLAHGEPPTPQHQAAHSCHVRMCCNPAHLRWATAQENSDDRLEGGRKLQGEDHPHAKLREADVARIRRSKRRASAMAKELNISTSAVYNIRDGHSWRHVI